MKFTSSYFYKRRFFYSFSKNIFETIFNLFEKNGRFETADIDELKEIIKKNEHIAFVSHNSSIIEQFLINGFFIKHGIALPTHSFGPVTIILQPFKETIFYFLKKFQRKEPNYPAKVKSVYVPLNQMFFFTHTEWTKFVAQKFGNDSFFVVPVTTLWNKNVAKRRKSRRRWLFPFTGKYNLWATFGELFMFLIGRRKLTVRIGLQIKVEKGYKHEELYHIFYRILQDEKKRIVGAALKNWFELSNETMMEFAEETPESLEKVRTYIREIETRYSPSDSDRISTLVNHLLSMMFSKIIYNSEDIKKLRRFASRPNINIVFIPTHKSYFDYLLLSNLLYREKVTVPMVISGENLNFFPLGFILRKVGAFFVRRKIKDNDLYRKVFQTYLKKVIQAGYNIEFFIEGGRSRSGRIRNPKTGILSMLAQIKKETKNRIYVVPVSITYEKLKEIDAYEKEKSKGKEPEKKGFLTKLFAIFNMRYAPAYINFSNPIYMSGKLNDSFSKEIAFRLETGNCISFSSIFSTFFLTHTKVNGERLLVKMEFIVNYLQNNTSYMLAPSLLNLDIHVPNLLQKLVKSGSLKEESDGKNIYSIKSNARHEFNFHKNSISHVFAPLAVFFAGEDADFISLFLEQMVKGYRRENDVKASELPAWLQSLSLRFFETLFLAFYTVIQLLGRTLPEKASSRDEIVKFLAASVEMKEILISTDELTDMLYFLEERGIVNNLFAINSDLLNNMSSLTERALNCIKAKGYEHYY